MAPRWLRVRLIDESYAQARSLTTSLLIYLMARIILIDQRMIISSSMQPTLAVGDRVLVDKKKNGRKFFGLREAYSNYIVQRDFPTESQGALDCAHSRRIKIPQASIAFGRLPGRRLDLRRKDIIVFRPPEACRLLFAEMSGMDIQSIGGDAGHSPWVAWKRRQGNELSPLNKSLDFTKRVVALSGDRVAVRRGLLYINDQAANDLSGVISLERAPRRTIIRRFWQGNDEYQHAIKPNYSSTTTVVPEDHVWVLGDHRDASFDSHIWGPLPMQNVVGRIRARYWPIHRAAWFRRDSASSAHTKNEESTGI